MSFFYLSPVKGDMPVYLLEENVMNRLLYLKQISDGENIAYNEFVIEGSVYDNAGHFMLCVAAILNENLDFLNFLLKAEVELFKRRLASLSSYDIRCFAKKLIRNIKKHEKVPIFIEPLQTLCQHLMLKDMAQHVCSPSHVTECFAHYIRLGFRHCLPFVAKRQVELNNGVVPLPCGRWKQYLILLFSMNLKYRLNNKNLTSLKSDPRIKELLSKITKIPYISKNSKYNVQVLKSQNVDSASVYFPPCMLNLHQHLRSKHRLSHSQRFYYSLFLKDIGMPVEEAVQFWRMEYQQSPNGTNACCHNWEKDEKRYLYGIRHMYGLEGGRKNYSSMSCKRIQGMDVSCSEGGCPFKSFDMDKMIKTLDIRPEDPILPQINELKSKGLYTSACVHFLQKKFNINNCDNTLSFNFSPVIFFVMSTENTVI